MRTKEVAQICGVTEECIRQNAKAMGVELGDRWHPHEWTDEEMKKLQVMLMKNQTSQGSTDSESTVRKITQTALGEGLAINVLSNSGDVEAMKEYCEMLIQKTQAQHDLLLEQQKNRELQAIVDKYVNWKSAREIKLEFKLPARPGIEKVAMLLNLKENEDWIARFYDDTHPYKKILYSPEAVGRIVEYVREN